LLIAMVHLNKLYVKTVYFMLLSEASH